ncbi:MAG: HD domain-containing protein [Pseudomonadota bacterium]|nr:HD domain-containing protein [Pseudomonadota bacterium]
MKEWTRVLAAADAAAKWHVHQRRKGPGQEPYLNHLLEVASLIAQATEGNDVELVIAALLHDAIEDQEVPASIIAERWGSAVAELVLEVTDDKTLSKEDRKQRQIDEAPNKTPRAKLLKLADKTSNLRSIAAGPPADWSVKRRLEYADWAEQVVSRLTPINRWLEGEFATALGMARQAIALSPGRS